MVNVIGNVNDGGKLVLEIIILEDGQQQLTWISNFIKRYTKFEELAVTIKIATPDAERIKNLIQTSSHQNLLFFLYVANDEGVRLGKYIRKKLPAANLVFIAACEGPLSSILKHRLAPLDYIFDLTNDDLVEEAIRKDINIALKRTVDHMYNNPEKFVYKLQNCYYDVPMSEILYIASKPNYVNRVILYTKNAAIELNDSLSNIEKRHPTLFRSHKGFIVNLSAVNYVDVQANRIYFRSHEELFCPISVRKK